MYPPPLRHPTPCAVDASRMQGGHNGRQERCRETKRSNIFAKTAASHPKMPSQIKVREIDTLT